MTHYDRAFIKAYAKDDRSPSMADRSLPIASKEEEKRSPSPLLESVQNLEAEPQEETSKREVAKPSSTKRRALSEVLGFYHNLELTPEPKEPSALPPSSAATKEILRVDGPHMVAPHRRDLFAGSTSLSTIDIDPPTDLPPKADPRPAPILPPRWKPQWEVDQFDWPSLCDDLLEATDEHLDQMIDRTHAALREGRPFLHVASRSRGAGRTTMALFLARVLAGTGLRVAIIDADFQAPQLACRLGVAAVADWNSATQSDTPLEETAIFSIDDAVTIFPLMHREQSDSVSPDSAKRTPLFDIWTTSFDLCLFDSPPIEESRTVADWMMDRRDQSSVVVVRDLRGDSNDDTCDLVDRLDADGIGLIGVVENYVGSQPTRRAA